MNASYQVVVGTDRPIKQSINQSHNTIFCAGKRKVGLAGKEAAARSTVWLASSVRASIPLARCSQPVHPGPACQAEPATSFTQFQLFFVFGARSAIRVWGAALSVSDLVRSAECGAKRLPPQSVGRRPSHIWSISSRMLWERVACKCALAISLMLNMLSIL